MHRYFKSWMGNHVLFDALSPKSRHTLVHQAAQENGMCVHNVSILTGTTKL